MTIISVFLAEPSPAKEADGQRNNGLSILSMGILFKLTFSMHKSSFTVNSSAHTHLVFLNIYTGFLLNSI